MNYVLHKLKNLYEERSRSFLNYEKVYLFHKDLQIDFETSWASKFIKCTPSPSFN